MPARIPPKIQRDIMKLRAKGLRVGQIAREVGLHRTTVSRYVEDADAIDTNAIEAAAAADFTAADVQVLRRLAREVAECSCEACGHVFVILVSTLKFRCPRCGVERQVKQINWKGKAAKVHK